MNTIGLDVHSATFTMAAYNRRGKLRFCRTMPTSGHNLIRLVQAIPGEKQLVLEESHMAQWTKHVLEPYVDRLVICDPRKNRWIAEDDFANDATSAKKLAELMMEGKVHEVCHPDDQGAELRSLFLHYHDLNKQITRFKNKLKGTFRSVAIVCSGATIYEGDHKSWLKQLNGYPHLRQEALHEFKLIDGLEAFKQETFRRMTRIARKNQAFKLICGIPGAGPVLAAGYIALIDTPHRFSRKNKLWKYAGLGNVFHESDGKVYKKGQSRSGNRVLKWIVVQHFQAAVLRSQNTNRFKIKYQKCQEEGLSWKEARRHVCRSILSVVRAVWMNKEAYRDNPAA